MIKFRNLKERVITESDIDKIRESVMKKVSKRCEQVARKNGCVRVGAIAKNVFQLNWTIYHFRLIAYRLEATGKYEIMPIKNDDGQEDFEIKLIAVKKINWETIAAWIAALTGVGALIAGLLQ